jgi:hypothetical protein
MNDDITNEFKAVAEEQYSSLEDNTQIDKNGLTFVKMSMSADAMNFIMDHYKLSSVVDVNMASIALLKILGNMEIAGWKFAIFKTITVNGKEVMTGESFGLDIHDLVKTALLQNQKPQQQKETNEQSSD